jgi:hypothetical protein
MYKVAFNTHGPEKNKDGQFCTACLACKKCHWFIKHSKVSYNFFGQTKVMQSAICSFNKKPYNDMRHKLFIYED